jgi:hypothetical protein
MPQDDVTCERDDEASRNEDARSVRTFDAYLRFVEHHDDEGFTDRVMMALPPSRHRLRQGILAGACGAGVVAALAWPGTRELAGTFLTVLRELDPVALSWGAVGVAACATLVAVWAAATV